MIKEDYVMFAVFNILFFFQGIPLPRQTKRTVFRDRPFPIIVVKKDTRRVLLYTNLIGINVIIIIIINCAQTCMTPLCTCMQGLFVLFAHVGSSDPVRVLHLLHKNTLHTIEAFIAETYVKLVATKTMCYSTS